MFTTQWTTAQQPSLILKWSYPRCQRKSDVSHIVLPSFALLYILFSIHNPTPNPEELEGGLLMDVESCFGPTAINSSTARSSLPVWWNLPNTAVCHTIQAGLQTNASFTCLLYCFACGPLKAKVNGCWGIKSHQVLLCPHLKLMQWSRSAGVQGLNNCDKDQSKCRRKGITGNPWMML